MSVGGVLRSTKVVLSSTIQEAVRFVLARCVNITRLTGSSRYRGSVWYSLLQSNAAEIIEAPMYSNQQLKHKMSAPYVNWIDCGFSKAIIPCSSRGGAATSCI